MKSSTKSLMVDISDLIVALQDIYYTFPKEMTSQDKQYFNMYITRVGESINNLDYELEEFKKTGFERNL